MVKIDDINFMFEWFLNFWIEGYVIFCFIFNGFLLLNNLEERNLFLVMIEEILLMIFCVVNNCRYYIKWSL